MGVGLIFVLRVLFDCQPRQVLLCWDLIHGRYRIFMPGMFCGIVEKSGLQAFATSLFLSFFLPMNTVLYLVCALRVVYDKNYLA